MNAEEVRKLAEKYESDKSPDSQAVAAVLFSLLGSMLMGGEVLHDFSSHCTNFSKMIVAQIDYSKWLKAG